MTDSATGAANPRKCPICKLPIEAEQLPSVLLEDGSLQVHIDCYARIESLKNGRAPKPGNGQSVAARADGGMSDHPAVPINGTRKLSSPTVLVVDDYAEWRAHVCQILSLSNCQIIGEARDGFEAVRIATDSQPDLILMDIGLPGMNGTEAAKLIRTKSPISSIVFLTHNNDADVRDIALSVGRAAYVLKSNVATELLQAMSAFLLTPPVAGRASEPGD